MLLLSIAASQNRRPVVTGGTLTSDSTYYYRTFTSGTGTLTITNGAVSLDWLCVGGGGGSGGVNAGVPYTSWTGGGGGSGGYTYINSVANCTGSYSISIGNGGGLQTNGGDSTISGTNISTTAYGGGYGGGWNNNTGNPISYGGGGGNGGNAGGGGAYTSYNSQSHYTYTSNNGGAGASGNNGGASLTGYTWVNGNTYAVGGSGGSSGGSATANTGNGAPGGGSGANGVVIFRYLKNAV